MTATSRPRIGLSIGHIHVDPQRKLFKGKELQYVEQKMAQSVWDGGGLPIALPDLRDPAAAAALIASVDGLLLQGGADVAPSSYGQVPLRPDWAGDPLRDRYEIALTHAALRAKKPVLGICRGIQIMNVALGGSLLQDIETQHEGALAHRDWHRYEIVEHEVTLAADSWVHAAYGGAERILVNTIHHQSLDRLGDGLAVTARAPDGVVEAVEHIDPGSRWLVGIQWHPEWLDGSPEGGPHRAPGAPIFHRFAERCAGSMAGV